ncbi:hypothetical protein [Paenibacillus pabuli]|uniref:hypothetical protein n=1 Tax=Paenibacillus pabuli TaxID=1472 RepID=UPI001FFEAB8C|nr:hypothetical protein [Paenibacillus pabuli]
MWADTVRAADPPTTTQTANGTNPWNLLHTTRTDGGVNRRQYCSSATGQTSRSGWGEQTMQAMGELVQVVSDAS